LGKDINKKGWRSILSDALRGKEQDYTKGSINTAIVLLAIPMMLEMVMESLFAITDVFFVAKLGQEAVATVGLTESVIMILESIAIGLSTAATALVARRIGEKKPELASNTAFQAVILTLGFSLILGITGWYAGADILGLMGGDATIVEKGSGYTSIMLGFNVTLMMLFVLNAVFRGAGNAAIAMKVLWISNGINIILDPCLIFGLGPFPELGLEGAAIATNIGRGTGVLIQLYVLLKGNSVIKFSGKVLTVSRDVMSSLIKVGAGGAGQFLISTASWVFMVRIIAIFGSAALAGYTIAFRIIIFSILPSWGLSNATATLVGQNLGANEPERSEITVWRAAHFNAIFLAVISVIFFLLAEPIVGFFDSSTIVKGYGVDALRIICCGYVFCSYGMIMSQAFNGAGDTRTPTLINVIVFWAVQLPLAYILAVNLDMGARGVFIAIAISLSLWAVVATALFRRGKWKTVVV
jgi:putative MATE family efflux protein